MQIQAKSLSVTVLQQEVQLPVSQMFPDPLPVGCEAEADCHLRLHVCGDVGCLIS